MKKSILILISVLVIAIAAIAVYKFGFTDKNDENGVVCTQDAKLCSDGSYVGRVAPDCKFAPCPEKKDIISEFDTNDEIREIFAQKYPAYAETLIIRINDEVGNYARGDVIFEEGQPRGGWLAAKIDDEWQIVYEGNGMISCDLKKYGFPDYMLEDCAEE